MQVDYQGRLQIAPPTKLLMQVSDAGQLDNLFHSPSNLVAPKLIKVGCLIDLKVLCVNNTNLT
jgi:hypothetical protein